MISNNGYSCEEMYGAACQPELEAVRMGVACYECRVCGRLTQGVWPEEADERAKSEGRAS